MKLIPSCFRTICFHIPILLGALFIFAVSIQVKADLLGVLFGNWKGVSFG